MQQEVSRKKQSQANKLIKYVQTSGIGMVMDRDTEETFALIPGEGNYPVQVQTVQAMVDKVKRPSWPRQSITDTVNHFDAAW